MEVLPQKQVHLAAFTDICYVFILIIIEQTWKKNPSDASDNMLPPALTLLQRLSIRTGILTGRLGWTTGCCGSNESDIMELASRYLNLLNIGCSCQGNNCLILRCTHSSYSNGLHCWFHSLLSQHRQHEVTCTKAERISACLFLNSLVSNSSIYSYPWEGRVTSFLLSKVEQMQRD